MPKDPTIHRFTVTGHGRFPFDMLRYDRCWPAKEGEMALLAERAYKRTIHIEGLRQPTTARWSSFGWEATT